jgi:hypothetical protein
MSTSDRLAPAQPTRRHHHTRTIRIDAYERSDGLWDFEARLVDVKSEDFRLASGLRAANEPVHDMLLTLTVDRALNIVAARAESLSVPYPGYCNTIGPAYGQLVGLNLMRGFRDAVKARLGGVAGCTHITELATLLPTAVIQAYAGVVLDTRDASAAEEQSVQPFQLDRCHALRTEAPAVREFYPRWYRSPTDPDPVG